MPHIELLMHSKKISFLVGSTNIYRIIFQQVYLLPQLWWFCSWIMDHLNLFFRICTSMLCFFKLILTGVIRDYLYHFMNEHVWDFHQEINISKFSISVLQTIVCPNDHAPKYVNYIKIIQQHGVRWYRGNLIHQTLMYILWQEKLTNHLKLWIDSWWQDTEESEEQCVLNDWTGLSQGFNLMSLRFLFEFRIMKRILKPVL